MEGIAAAKKRGVYKGWRRQIDTEEIRRLREEENLGLPRSPAASPSAGYQSSGFWLKVL